MITTQKQPTIALFSPATPLKSKLEVQAVQMAVTERFGARVIFGEDCYSWNEIGTENYPSFYFNEPDACYQMPPAARADILLQYLQDPDIDFIWCVRGGASTETLFPYLREQDSWFRQAKKQTPIMGFSDVTALFLFLARYHWPTVHGPVATHCMPERLAADSYQHLTAFWQTGETQWPQCTPLNQVAKEVSEINGVLIGGNLALVQRSISTDWQIKSAGKILFLEDINEEVYQVQRKLSHLTEVGLLQDLRALVFGHFNFTESRPVQEALITKFLARFASDCPYPVLHTPCIGHGSHNYPLRFNEVVRIKL